MTGAGETSLYRVVRILGRGGMATVYEGWDEKLERPVAIKELAEHFVDDDRLMRLFVDEARKMAAVSHPNILSIYAIDESSESPRIIMELAAGGTLRDQIRRGPTQPQQARRILEQLLLGLREIHRHDGMIHRDVKPENILLVKHLYKIGDFGIAKGAGDRTAPFVTPRYTAPECLSAPELVGPASDLYSLGLVIYELALGEERFARAIADAVGQGGRAPVGRTPSSSESGDGQAWFDLHLRSAELPALRELDGSVPEDLSRVVAGMMRKDAAARYSSCDEVLEELAGADGSATIVESGVSTVQHAVSRRRPLPRVGLLAAGGLLLLLAAAFLVLSAGRGAQVDVTSEPAGAEVFAAGERLGVTPLLGVRFDQDTELLLRKEGYRDAELRVGAGSSEAHAHLVWRPVTISSEPEGAKVLVAGEVWGLTPCDLIGRGASAEVTLRLPGYEESTLEVTPGEERRHVVLSWQPVTVTSEPSGARILAAGEILGQTPFEYVGQGVGSWLTLRMAGFEDVELEVSPGQRAVHVELSVRPVAPPVADPVVPPSDVVVTPPSDPVPAVPMPPPPEPVAPPSPEDELLALLDRGRDPALALDGAVRPGRLPVGTPLRFRLISRGWSGEVVLFSLLPGGEVLRFYPNRLRRSLRLEPLATLLLPLPEDERRGFVLETSPPLGRDRVFALVSSAPLPPMPPGESSHPWFASYPRGSAGRGSAGAFLRWAAALRRSQPATTRLVAVEIEVVENPLQDTPAR